MQVMNCVHYSIKNAHNLSVDNLASNILGLQSELSFPLIISLVYPLMNGRDDIILTLHAGLHFSLEEL